MSYRGLRLRLVGLIETHAIGSEGDRVVIFVFPLQQNIVCIREGEDRAAWRHRQSRRKGGPS